MLSTLGCVSSKSKEGNSPQKVTLFFTKSRNFDFSICTKGLNFRAWTGWSIVDAFNICQNLIFQLRIKLQFEKRWTLFWVWYLSLSLPFLPNTDNHSTQEWNKERAYCFPMGKAFNFNSCNRVANGNRNPTGDVLNFLHFYQVRLQ